MCLKPSTRRFDQLVSLLQKKYRTEIDIISCSAYRKTKALRLDYRVDYIMAKGQDPYNLYDMKYAMLVNWANAGKYAIIIGQNPSNAQTIKSHAYNVDDTNWNIIKILEKNNYAGYIMLNTFPEIDPSGKAFAGAHVGKKEELLNINISNYIIKHSRDLDTVLACTTTNSISTEYYNKIITTHNVCKFSNPPITHFATQALGKLLSYTNIVVLPVTPKVTINSIAPSLCTIAF